MQEVRAAQMAAGIMPGHDDFIFPILEGFEHTDAAGNLYLFHRQNVEAGSNVSRANFNGAGGNYEAWRNIGARVGPGQARLQDIPYNSQRPGDLLARNAREARMIQVNPDAQQDLRNMALKARVARNPHV